ncbi:transporter substrate-binding domain-containing protein [Collinsella sp. BIOML-A4]|uniref:transporter substrate-binding domain-containing protein n=1 Tax=unclassified Collinsella TaxID=2637548 RepID=UPI00136D6A36|nr:MULTISPECIES: transporter substrate-binding domain-containing protein [unclassified Collinsella]MZJ32968.1 transporter substrate-binding domain-containing protein [Collinsella sp. BIOML-A1]MZJ27564.1 transporter substrate-binding domain-containing protein [Collinsella sp. BIOML-A2]MZJ29118.1 transporter substrate-binding domain-containing protein [Collinsella sp. BIOML-A3]MZJ96681.1 transporter substrate-binding domain-containing protein [Collinsella sp. BIOML-A6]MZK30487.1 transporter subs
MDMSRRQFLQVAGMGILSVASMGTLAGCGSSSDGKSGSASGGSDSKLAAIKDRGKLKCGVKKDVIGYGYLDTKTKKYEGLEIDLCYQIAAAVLGVSYDEAVEKGLCEFTDVTPKTRGPLIDNDQLDIIAATYTITDERKKSWDFSTPYRTDHVGILIKKKSGMTKMADLDGKIIGVSQGSTTKDLVLQMLKDQNVDATPEFKEFPDYPSIKSALDAGNIDAFAMDRSTLKGYTTDDCELLQPDVEFGAQDYGVATKKGSDLSKTVDDTVKKLKKDGWLDKEYTKWDLL